jgi:hypothetical protein
METKEEMDKSSKLNFIKLFTYPKTTTCENSHVRLTLIESTSSSKDGDDDSFTHFCGHYCLSWMCLPFTKWQGKSVHLVIENKDKTTRTQEQTKEIKNSTSTENLSLIAKDDSSELEESETGLKEVRIGKKETKKNLNDDKRSYSASDTKKTDETDEKLKNIISRFGVIQRILSKDTENVFLYEHGVKCLEDSITVSALITKELGSKDVKDFVTSLLKK